jgi:hypothetical protein
MAEIVKGGDALGRKVCHFGAQPRLLAVIERQQICKFIFLLQTPMFA